MVTTIKFIDSTIYNIANRFSGTEIWMKLTYFLSQKYISKCHLKISDNFVLALNVLGMSNGDNNKSKVAIHSIFSIYTLVEHSWFIDCKLRNKMLASKNTC